MRRRHVSRPLSTSHPRTAPEKSPVTISLPLSANATAVVTWPTTTNKAYQVETSADVSGNYVPAGQLIEGTGGMVGAFFGATTPAQFFRVQETNASGINWLEGVWQGTTYQASSNVVPFMTLISITNSNRTFSGIYSNSTFSCSAIFDLLSYSDSQASFHTRIQSGGCADGVIVVTAVNSTNAFYNWYYFGSPWSFGQLATAVWLAHFAEKCGARKRSIGAGERRGTAWLRYRRCVRDRAFPIEIAYDCEDEDQPSLATFVSVGSDTAKPSRLASRRAAFFRRLHHRPFRSSLRSKARIGQRRCGDICRTGR